MEMEWESEFSEYTEMEWEISIPFNTDVDPRVYVAVRWVPVTITWENGWSEKGDMYGSEKVDMYGFRIYEVELISGVTDDIVLNLIQYSTVLFTLLLVEDLCWVTNLSLSLSEKADDFSV